MLRMSDALVIAGRTFTSRLIVGTGKYKSGPETARAIEASGAEMVTVAVRRVNLDRSTLSIPNATSSFRTLPPVTPPKRQFAPPVSAAKSVCRTG